MPFKCTIYLKNGKPQGECSQASPECSETFPTCPEAETYGEEFVQAMHSIKINGKYPQCYYMIKRIDSNQL